MPVLDPRNVTFLLNDLVRLLRLDFERRMTEQPVSVTPAEARVLAHVAREGTARQNVLAERLGIGPMSLTGFLDRLEAAGLVARTGDPTDRRAKLVSLTPEAGPVIETIARLGEETRRLAREGIADADWTLFSEVLGRAVENLQRSREVARRAAREGEGA